MRQTGKSLRELTLAYCLIRYLIGPQTKTRGEYNYRKPPATTAKRNLTHICTICTHTQTHTHIRTPLLSVEKMEVQLYMLQCIKRKKPSNRSATARLAQCWRCITYTPIILSNPYNKLLSSAPTQLTLLFFYISHILTSYPQFHSPGSSST